MKNKIVISKNQQRQFNVMLEALKLISQGYQTPDQLKRGAIKNEYGLEYEEVITMAYENIQLAARVASKGVRKIAGI